MNWDSADRVERVNMALEKRFLRVRRVDPVDSFVRVREQVHEHMTLRLRPIQDTRPRNRPRHPYLARGLGKQTRLPDDGRARSGPAARGQGRARRLTMDWT